MANTYSQLNVQCVFSVKNRDNMLSQSIRQELFPYIAGILKNINLYPLAVNGYHDHVHVFFELNNDITVAKVMDIVKASSSKWINERKLVKGHFEWQRGYGSFSYSRSQRPDVINYIINQEVHHGKLENTFKKEYLKMLDDFEIVYDPRYLFEFYE